MGILYTCDGCDKTATKKFPTYSFVLKDDYDEVSQWTADLCDSCRLRVDDPKTWARPAKEPSNG